MPYFILPPRLCSNLLEDSKDGKEASGQGIVLSDVLRRRLHVDREILAAAIERNPELEITVDVEDHKVWFDDEFIKCDIKAGARESLLNGTYDPLDELLEGAANVTKVTDALPYMQA